MDTKEKEFLKFLIDRIRKCGGSIPIQKLTGHLSLVKPEIREAIGTSKYDICRFIEKHCKTFIFEKGVVRLISSINIKDYDSDDSAVETEISLPQEISNGKGVVVKVTPSFGFIKIQHPVKSSAYFRASHFGFPEQADLTDCGIYIGTMVYLDAVRENRKDSKSKYRTKKAWKMNPNDEIPIQSTAPKKKPIKPDPINLDGEGTINNVFASHGFITVDNDPSNSVFFHKKCVMNYNNITDLTKVFTAGELVEFSSHRTTKADAKVRWEATKVWKKSSSLMKKVIQSPSSHQTLTTQNLFSKTKFEAPEKQALLNLYHESIKNVDLTPKNRNREVIYDQVGKICPRQSGCVIKFGKNFEHLADGDSCLYYIDGTKVQDVAWEFTEGDSVKFDAVKIKSSPGWKAIIVWMGGEKPVHGLPDWPELGSFSGEDDLDADEQSSVSSRDKLKSPSLADSAFSERPPSSLSSSKESEKSYHVALPQEKGIKEVSNEPVKNDWYEMTINYERNEARDKDPPEQEIAKKQSSLKKYEDEAKDKISQEQEIAKKQSSIKKYEDEAKHEVSQEQEIAKKQSSIKKYEDEAKHEVSQKQEIYKKQSSIKKFEDVQAKITKVFSMFAEAELLNTSASIKTISFSSKIFFKDRESMSDKDVLSLKEVLKENQLIFINFFEIVDDEGQQWQKATAAWLGKKPKTFCSMTPEEFIVQNKLSVTATNQLNETPLSDSKNTSSLNSLEETEALENSSEEPDQDYSNVFARSALLEKPLFDYESLSVMICQKLKDRDVNLNDMNLDALYSEIASLVLYKYSLSCDGEKEKLSRSDDCKDVEVQTLSTGPVWFPTVFLDE